MKKLLIAVAFPLTMKAQTDTIIIPDTTRMISPRMLREGVQYLPKEWTIGEGEKVVQFIEAIIRKAAAEYNRQIQPKAK